MRSLNSSHPAAAARIGVMLENNVAFATVV